MSEDTEQFDAAIVRAVEAIQSEAFEAASEHLESALESRFVPAVAEALAMVDRRRAGEAVDLAAVIDSLRARPDDEFFGADLIVDESDLSSPPSFDDLATTEAAVAPPEPAPADAEQRSSGPRPSVSFEVPRERDWSQDAVVTAEVTVAADDPWFDEDDEELLDLDEVEPPPPALTGTEEQEPARTASARYRGVEPPPPDHRAESLGPGDPMFQTSPGPPGSGGWLPAGSVASAGGEAAVDSLPPGEQGPGGEPVAVAPDDVHERVTSPLADEERPSMDAEPGRIDPGATPLPAQDPGSDLGPLPVAALLERIDILSRRGDLASALKLCDEALLVEPGNATAMRYQRDARSRMAMLQMARLEPLDRTPKADLALAAAAQGLTPQKMFVLTQADGVSSLHDLIDLSGLSRDEACAILIELYDSGLLVD